MGNHWYWITSEWVRLVVQMLHAQRTQVNLRGVRAVFCEVGDKLPNPANPI